MRWGSTAHWDYFPLPTPMPTPAPKPVSPIRPRSSSQHRPQTPSSCIENFARNKTRMEGVSLRLQSISALMPSSLFPPPWKRKKSPPACAEELSFRLCCEWVVSSQCANVRAVEDIQSVLFVNQVCFKREKKKKHVLVVCISYGARLCVWKREREESDAIFVVTPLYYDLRSDIPPKGNSTKKYIYILFFIYFWRCSSYYSFNFALRCFPVKVHFSLEILY